MSTRSFVGTIQNHRYRARYVHSDGYPEHMLTTLAALLERQDASALLKVLTEDHYGWSYLDPGASGPLGKGYDDGRFVIVDGFGRAYTTHDGQSHSEQWVQGVLGEPSADAEWLDFGYVFDLDERTLLVLDIEVGGVARSIMSIPLDALSDWSGVMR